jgi:glucokinase
MGMAMILAGDIGGTNCRLGLFDEQLRLLRDESFQNANRPGVESAVEEFFAHFAQRPVVTRACFGVAGPVAAGRVKLTNLDWHLEEDALIRNLKIERVGLINDLRAHAEGVEMLGRDDVLVLNDAAPQATGNRVVVAAGTGLGEAGLVWDENVNHHHAVACEGGHCDFSPRTEREWKLLEFLRKTSKPLTWEAVLSGPGLRNIYDFLIGENQLGATAALAEKDPSPSTISKMGMDGSNRACSETLDLFIALYGAEAGNLALKYLATGGVYLGGGIAPKIAARIRTSKEFLNRFSDKGPGNIQKLLQSMPIYIINSPANALYGAANYARRLLPQG